MLHFDKPKMFNLNAQQTNTLSLDFDNLARLIILTDLALEALEFGVYSFRGLEIESLWTKFGFH